MHTMKKVMPLIIILAILFFISSCSLALWLTGIVYFYEMAGEHNNPSDFTLLYRNEGYTIIMSRGVEGVQLSKVEAQKLITSTLFTLTLDDEALEAIGTKSVDELGRTGWHVVQSYTLPRLGKGTYELCGKTICTDIEGNFSRENIVTVNIK